MAVSSCALLNNLQLPVAPGVLKPPTITFQGATLVQAPSEKLLSAYYCPEVVPDPFGIRGGASTLCQGFFGRRPTLAEMAVAFDLHFKVANPNNVPLPLATVLTAATVFPAAQNQKLGAVCVQLCPQGAACSGQPAPGACEASSRDIRSLSDFQNVAGGLLIAAGVALATGQPLTFTAPQVSAASELDVTVRFSFGPEQMMTTLKQVAMQSVDQLKAGRTVRFLVPFRLEGTVWFDAGSIGRLAVGFGPADGTWELPTAGLIPR
jgi:hypothetical protein